MSIYPEFAKQRAVWAFWPESGRCRPGTAVAAQKAFARLVSCLSRRTPVFVAAPAAERERARFIIQKHITVHALDTAGLGGDVPGFVSPDRGAGCETAPAAGENRAAAPGPLAQMRRILPAGAAEAGPAVSDFETDGLGTFFVTDRLLRESGLTPPLLEKEFGRFGEVCRVVALPCPAGLVSVRRLVRCAAPGVLVANRAPRGAGGDAGAFERALRLLAGLRDAEGRRFEILELPCGFGGTGIRTYLDFMISNGNIVVPLSDPGSDNEALLTLQEFFAERGGEANGVEAGDFPRAGLDFRKLAVPVYAAR